MTDAVDTSAASSLVDVLGQPLRLGELYVSVPGGALVPVTVEGVRWLVDKIPLKEFS